MENARTSVEQTLVRAGEDLHHLSAIVDRGLLIESINSPQCHAHYQRSLPQLGTMPQANRSDPKDETQTDLGDMVGYQQHSQQQPTSTQGQV